jgi:hypothetical protein
MRPIAVNAIRLAAAAALAAALGACAPTAAPTPTPASTLTTGVRGHVTIDGGCPVIRQDSPCPDKPYQARVVVFPAGSDAGIANVITDAGGLFSIALPPGSYTLRGENLAEAVMPHASPVDVVVPDRGYAEATIQFDSGIR